MHIYILFIYIYIYYFYIYILYYYIYIWLYIYIYMINYKYIYIYMLVYIYIWYYIWYVPGEIHVKCKGTTLASMSSCLSSGATAGWRPGLFKASGWVKTRDPGNHRDPAFGKWWINGYSWDLMGFSGDYGVSWWFNEIFMGFYGNLLGIHGVFD